MPNSSTESVTNTSFGFCLMLALQTASFSANSSLISVSQLAISLIGNYCSRKCPSRPSLSLQLSKRFCTSHFPVRGAEKQQRCHYCKQYRHECHSTVWYCNDCQLFLCHNGWNNDCFSFVPQASHTLIYS